MARKNRRRAARRSLPTETTRHRAPEYRRWPYGPTPRNAVHTLSPVYNSNARKFVADAAARRATAIPSRQLARSTFPRTYTNTLPTAVSLTKAEAKIYSLCESRKRREEVLHAIKKTGKRGQKSPKWTRLSKVRC